MMRAMSSPSKPPIRPVHESPRAESSAHTPQPARWSSQALLGGRQQIEIEHNNAIYRLRVTSLGKLILTK
jgi:hemin uptake protein HemP